MRLHIHTWTPRTGRNPRVDAMSEPRHRTTSDGLSTFREDAFPELPEILQLLRSIDENLQTIAKSYDPGAELRALATALRPVPLKASTGQAMSP